MGWSSATTYEKGHRWPPWVWTRQHQPDAPRRGLRHGLRLVRQQLKIEGLVEGRHKLDAALATTYGAPSSAPR